MAGKGETRGRNSGRVGTHVGDHGRVFEPVMNINVSHSTTDAPAVSGMLSGAVCGDVFASPSSKAVLEGIKAVSGDKGALLIVKNYTGDRLNFGRALAKARAEGHVPKIEMVVVADDCGIPRNKSMAGRRGLAGTVFVHKIAGHFAGLGRPLDSVAKIANQVAQNVGTVGFSLSPCSIPGKSPAFTLGPDEIEVALGIHGEAGVSRMKIKTSAELAKLCVDMILSEENDRGYLPVDPQNDDQVVLMVNNLGGTSALEIGIVVNDAVQYLSSRGLPPIRIYAGTFMTSLEMQGVQICLLRVPRGEIGEQFLEGLDGETDAMAWPRSWDQSVKDLAVPLSPMTESSSGQKPPFTGSSGPAQTSYAASMALAVCRSLIDAEPDITLFDQIAGDGDAGNTIAAGASAVIEAINGGKVGASGDMSSFIRDVSAVCEDTMGGSFGAVLCIFLDTVAGHLREHGSASPTTKELADAVLAGTAAARHIGGANPGDRTMVDALVPFAQTLRESLSLEKAATAAKEGAEFTKTLRSARLGRASYLVGKTLDVPDPGAHAVAVAVLAAAGVKA